MQTYVSQLRKALGAEAIVTRPPGYLLRVEEEALDAAASAPARRGAPAGGRGEQQERAGRPLPARRSRSGAGPPLADVAFDSFARNEVERLAEERLEALTDRIDCELALGRHDELVAELETLVGQHPLRERLRAQLMLALYRSGRQADALAAYQDARRTLVDELGLEPSRELQELEKAILIHDPDVAGALPRTARAAGASAALRVAVLAVVAILVPVGVSLGLAFVLQDEQPAARLLEPNSVGFIDVESGARHEIVPGRRGAERARGCRQLSVGRQLPRQDATRIDRVTGIRSRFRSRTATGLAEDGTIWVWTLQRRLVPIRFEKAGNSSSLGRGVAPRRPDPRHASRAAQTWIRWEDRLRRWLSLGNGARNDCDPREHDRTCTSGHPS